MRAQRPILALALAALSDAKAAQQLPVAPLDNGPVPAVFSASWRLILSDQG